jgi:hypothetical protein
LVVVSDFKHQAEPKIDFNKFKQNFV